MEPRFRRISCLLVLICITFSVQAQDTSDFPHLTDLVFEFYETEVTVLDQVKQFSSFAKEMFDNTTGHRGMLNVITNGDKTSYYHNNLTKQVLSITPRSCQVWDFDESDEYYDEIFYGWLNREPFIIGPTALMWKAQQNRDKIIPLNETVIRDINCVAYSLQIQNDTEDIEIKYHFSAQDWTTPYQLDVIKQVPIRIEVQGKTKKNVKDGNWVSVNLITDFSYFRPTISDMLALQPPVGIGCQLRKTSRTPPKIPKVFKYSAEVYDSVKTRESLTTDIEFQRVYYDSVRQLARLDKYSVRNRLSEFYDFNTGVTYSIADSSTCTIKPLRNSFFEGYDGDLIGHLKDPSEVLNMDGKFYYMGQRQIRGILADSFESVEMDVTFQKQSLYKLVVTAFFSPDYYAVAVDGELEENQIPVYYIVTGWSNATNIKFQLHYNIFAFDDVIYPDMYQSFDLTRCYPTMDEKSYFLLILNVPPEVAAKMEGADDMVKLALKGLIVETCDISDMRIPLLNIDYKTQGVFVTGLILDRPPALSQFWLENTGEVRTADKFVKMIGPADTKEKCAYACVDEESYICQGFYFCGRDCFLKSEGILEQHDEKEQRMVFDSCETWLRSETRSNNKESYLVDALTRLETAVVNETLNYYFKVNDTVGIKIPITDIIIGDGPYTGDYQQEKPYSVVLKLAKLKADDETTISMHDVGNLNECYKACKTSDDINCASFSYCPEADNKQCLISSVLVTDRKKNDDDVEGDAKCFVYSLKYLDFYVAYPGRVSLLAGEDLREKVTAVEDCAKFCREETKFICRGFEYCRSARTCVLHSKHVMDMKEGDFDESNKKTTCTHYAAKFAADYYDMGYTLIKDQSDKRNEITLEQCAKVCSEERKDNCKSFNYCPASGPYMTDSSCELSTKVLENKPDLETRDKCHHYEKKEVVDDWAKTSNKIKKIIPNEDGYTKKGFTGLVIGMLALGLILGAMGFVLFSYIKSKRYGGEGMTVRFMKSDI